MINDLTHNIEHQQPNIMYNIKYSFRINQILCAYATIYTFIIEIHIKSKHYAELVK